jgi:hypothetical protein
MSLGAASSGWVIRAAPWTLALPALPVALSLAVASLELSGHSAPLGAVALLGFGLFAFWMRELSAVRLDGRRLAVRWYGLTERSVDLSRLVSREPARTLTPWFGATRCLRLRDADGRQVDLPLGWWTDEPALIARLLAIHLQVD